MKAIEHQGMFTGVDDGSMWVDAPHVADATVVFRCLETGGAVRKANDAS